MYVDVSQPAAQLRVYDLPCALHRRARAHYRRDDVPVQLVIAYIRHHHTNYDQVRKRHGLSHRETMALKRTVNRQIRRKLRHWITEQRATVIKETSQ